jgi:hypothetical protein
MLPTRDLRSVAVARFALDWDAPFLRQDELKRSPYNREPRIRAARFNEDGVELRRDVPTLPRGFPDLFIAKALTVISYGSAHC